VLTQEHPEALLFGRVLEGRTLTGISRDIEQPQLVALVQPHELSVPLDQSTLRPSQPLVVREVEGQEGLRALHGVRIPRQEAREAPSLNASGQRTSVAGPL
jgi:hypothetical protein